MKKDDTLYIILYITEYQIHLFKNAPKRHLTLDLTRFYIYYIYPVYVISLLIIYFEVQKNNKNMNYFNLLYCFGLVMASRTGQTRPTQYSTKLYNTFQARVTEKLHLSNIFFKF